MSMSRAIDFKDRSGPDRAAHAAVARPDRQLLVEQRQLAAPAQAGVAEAFAVGLGRQGRLPAWNGYAGREPGTGRIPPIQQNMR